MSIDPVATECSAVGPSLELAEWPRRVKAGAWQRGWRVATGIGGTGLPWAAHTDIEERRTPWNRLGLRRRSCPEMYPPEA